MLFKVSVGVRLHWVEVGGGSEKDRERERPRERARERERDRERASERVLT